MKTKHNIHRAPRIDAKLCAPLGPRRGQPSHRPPVNIVHQAAGGPLAHRPRRRRDADRAHMNVRRTPATNIPQRPQEGSNMTATIESIATVRTRRPAIGTLRLRLKPAHQACGFVQGAWWPRSTLLTVELPSLLAALSLRFGRIDRVQYRETDWSQAPQHIKHQGAGIVLDSSQDSPNIISCSFSNPVSPREPRTCSDSGRLTRCHLASVSNSCHFFRRPLPIPLATYAIGEGHGQPVRKIPSLDGYPRGS
jgi:hypothetical protein